MRVVVFGAAGNIGTSVLERLGSREVVREIVGVARRVPRRPYPRTRFVSADVAAEPALRADDLAGALDAGLRRTDPESLRKTPSFMRTERARSVLGWRPQRSATFALTELLDGLARGACLDTPPLRPQRRRGLEDALGMPERARGGAGR